MFGGAKSRRCAAIPGLIDLGHALSVERWWTRALKSAHVSISGTVAMCALLRFESKHNAYSYALGRMGLRLGCACGAYTLLLADTAAC